MEIPVEDMWAELRDILVRIKAFSILEVDILFGFAWGNFIYPTKEWEYIRLPLEDIETRIKKEEDNKHGKLGSDDLYIRHPDLLFEIQFCHESDIHILFNQRTPFINAIEKECKAKGFNPKELTGKGDLSAE
jgi:hypothetical protein